MKEHLVSCTGITLTQGEMDRLAEVFRNQYRLAVDRVVFEDVVWPNHSKGMWVMEELALAKVNRERQHVGVPRLINGVNFFDGKGVCTRSMTAQAAVKEAWGLGFRFDGASDEAYVAISRRDDDVKRQGQVARISAADHRSVSEQAGVDFSPGQCWYLGPYRSESLAQESIERSRNCSWEELGSNPAAIVFSGEVRPQFVQALSEGEHMEFAVGAKPSGELVIEVDVGDIGWREMGGLVENFFYGCKLVCAGDRSVVFVPQQDVVQLERGLRDLVGDHIFDGLAVVHRQMDEDLSVVLRDALPDWCDQKEFTPKCSG